MKERLEAIREQAIAKIKDAKDISVLNDVRVEILGKKGQLTEVLKGMKDVAPEDRPKVGQLVNDTRKRIEEELENVKKDLEAKAREAKLKAEVIDVTLPAKKNKVGHKHPNTLALEELERIFVGMGYEVVEGPEVEFDHYNFEALNIPENHPAKDEQDTFYINKNIVLRTQTSSVQARVMENTQPPIRIVSPGRVFRSDQVDATHSPSFHQIEGLVIDKNVTMADLKGTLEQFAKELFGENTKIKLDHITSHLQNQVQKLTLHALSVAVKDVDSVRVKAGLKFLVVVWFIHMYLKWVELTLMNIRDLHLV